MLFHRSKGMIGYLGLQDFWKSLTPAEKQYLNSTEGKALDEGEVYMTNRTPLHLLWTKLGWAVSAKRWTLCDKIMEHAEKYLNGSDLINAHFFYLNAAECCYKRRDLEPDALARTEAYCLRDVKLFQAYKRPLKKDMGGDLPRLGTFDRLIIMYDKQGRYKEAIDICKLAIKYKLETNTKDGYKGRLEKLNAKLEKAKQAAK